MSGDIDPLSGLRLVGVDAIVSHAVDLMGLSYSASRDSYCTALYPLDLPAQARQMGAEQSACGLVCEAILRKASVDGRCNFRGVERDWLQMPYAARLGTAVAYQEALGRARRAWVSGIATRPSTGDMVTVVGPEHVLTVVGVQPDGVLRTVEGGQIDAGNGGKCTAIRGLKRVLVRDGDAWILRTAGTHTGGRRVLGWMRASMLPVLEADAPPTQPTGVVDLTSVRGWQRALISLGYDLGPSGADGVVGTRTRAAVVAFQTRAGLVADGVVGPLTRAALQAALAAP